MILNILLLLSMVALLTVVPLLPGLITARLVRTELVRNPRGVAVSGPVSAGLRRPVDAGFGRRPQPRRAGS